MKVYYRHTKSGDLGYLEEDEDGKRYIVMDRPQESIRRPFREAEWSVDKERRPLNRAQMAMIAQQADSVLCRVMGEAQVNKKDWASLSDQQRIAWMKRGPKGGVRARLYAFIMEAIAPLGPGESE